MRFRFGSIPAAQRRANETPGTDRRAGFVIGDADLAGAAAGAGSVPADIAGEFISGGGAFELRGPARNCLPRRERRGVLQMRSPNDNDLSELYGRDGENVPKFREGGDQALSGGAGALGLRPPKVAGGSLDFTEVVVFDAEGHVQIPLRNKSTQVRR